MWDNLHLDLYSGLLQEGHEVPIVYFDEDKSTFRVAVIQSIQEIENTEEEDEDEENEDKVSTERVIHFC